MAENLEQRIKELEDEVSQSPQNLGTWEELSHLYWRYGSENALRCVERALLLQTQSSLLARMRNKILFHGLYTIGSPRFRHGDVIRKVRITPDGHILSASDDKTCRMWDLTGQEVLRFIGHSKPLNSFDFSWSQKKMVTSSQDHTCRVWNIQTGEELISFSGHGDVVSTATFTPDGKHILSGGEDGTCRLWKTDSGEEVLCFDKHKDAVSALAVSSDGRLAVSGDWTGLCIVWILESGKAGVGFRNHKGMINTLRFSSDKRYILSTSEDGTIRLWDAAKGDEVRSFEGHKESVEEANFSSDEKTILSCSADRTLRRWDKESGSELRTIESSHPLYSIALHPQGNFAVSCGGDQSIRVWNLEDGRELSHPFGHRGKILDMRIGEFLSTVGSDDSCRIWSLATGEELAVLEKENSRARTTVLPGSGKRAIVAGDDNTARVWDWMEKRVLFEFSEHDGPIYSVASHPDGERAITCDGSGKALIWQVESGAVFATIEPNLGSLFKARFFPSGEFVVLGCEKNACVVVDSHKGVEFCRFEGHEAPVRALCIDSEERVISASQDNVIKMWEGGTGNELASLGKFDSRIFSLISLRPSQIIASAHENGKVRFFDLKKQQEVHVLQLNESVLCLDYNSKEKELLAGLSNGCIRRIPQFEILGRRRQE